MNKELKELFEDAMKHIEQMSSEECKAICDKNNLNNNGTQNWSMIDGCFVLNLDEPLQDFTNCYTETTGYTPQLKKTAETYLTELNKYKSLYTRAPKSNTIFVA